jgi:hypothetical protein
MKLEQQQQQQSSQAEAQQMQALINGRRFLPSVYASTAAAAAVL